MPSSLAIFSPGEWLPTHNRDLRQLSDNSPVPYRIGPHFHVVNPRTERYCRSNLTIASWLVRCRATRHQNTPTQLVLQQVYTTSRVLDRSGIRSNNSREDTFSKKPVSAVTLVYFWPNF